MNKKVLKTMLWLVVGELIAWYILKIFFPEQFVMAIQNENLIKAGQYIDTHKWALILCVIISNLISYNLYLCAVIKKPRLNIKQFCLVCISIALVQGIYEFDYNLANGISIIIMFLLPLLFKAEFKTTVIVFSIHYISQLISLSIRDLPSLLQNVNSIIAILLSLESYFWLFLFYLYYNYKEKEV